MSYLPGKFVWFEHMSSDVPKARKFYEQLFAWHTEVMPMGDKRYSMIHNGDEGIGGYTESPAGVPNHWIGYVSVPDVDQTHAAALAAGAKQLMAPTDFGPIGRGSAIKDPTGAPFCLWKSKDGDRPDAAQPVVGNWCWNELWTPDEQTALAFYEKIIGYTHDTMDMGEQGTYYMLKKDGISRAGVRLVTFAPVLKHGLFPLAEIVDALMEMGVQGTSGPVEIEFAHAPGTHLTARSAADEPRRVPIRSQRCCPATSVRTLRAPASPARS